MKWSIARACASVVILLGVSVVLIADQGQETGTIRGLATDLFGFPIANAEIEVATTSSERHFQTRTDVNGSYELKNMPAEQVSVRINAVGFLREERRTRLAGGETVLVDFGLEAGKLTDLPTVKVSGTVYGRQNTPVKDATIRITNAFKASLLFVGRTDERGRYVLEVDTPGQYIVSVSKPGYVTNTQTVLLMPDLPRKGATANFVLSPFKLN